MASLRPEDPCGCGNGKLYRDCHQVIHEAPDGTMMTIAQKIYSTEWTGNADAYFKQGLYDRLADHLLGHGEIQSVIDVGCGLGNGLRSLRDKIAPAPFRLLGIDENPDCLSAAARNLALGDMTGNIQRMQSELLSSGYYRWRYLPGELISRNNVNLVQSNLLVHDPVLETFLTRQGPADAVTLWFIGVHKATANTELARHFEIKGDADYRELVEGAVIEMAKTLLRPGGLLQVAIRGGFPSMREAREHTAFSYEPYFTDQGFRLKSVEAFPYSEPTGDRAISVRSAGSPQVNALPVYAVSMIGQKAEMQQSA